MTAGGLPGYEISMPPRPMSQALPPLYLLRSIDSCPQCDTPIPVYTLAADALLRGVAVGLTSARLIATIRRLRVERRLRRR